MRRCTIFTFCTIFPILLSSNQVFRKFAENWVKNMKLDFYSLTNVYHQYVFNRDAERMPKSGFEYSHNIFESIRIFRLLTNVCLNGIQYVHVSTCDALSRQNKVYHSRQSQQTKQSGTIHRSSRISRMLCN